MRRQARVIHLAHPRIRREPRGDAPAVGVVLAHAQRERLDAAQGEAGIGLARHRAERGVVWRCVPPSTFSPLTPWPPAESSLITASTAARPDANAKPWRPPSSAATLRSSASRVGLRVRAYSKPLFAPSASWM